MTDADGKLSRRYRELAREEPPPAADAAILAAGRAAARRPRLGRWAVPVSIAAVLVLGIGLSLRMQMEQPGVETAMPPSEYAPAAPAVEPPPPSAPPSSPSSAPPEAAVLQAAPPPAARAKREAPPAADRAREAQAREERRRDPDPLPMRSAPRAFGNAAPDEPARELERIARLREEGHGAEADRALEQFRKDHPGYRIPEALWERVRPR